MATANDQFDRLVTHRQLYYYAWTILAEKVYLVINDQMGWSDFCATYGVLIDLVHMHAERIERMNRLQRPRIPGESDSADSRQNKGGIEK